MEINDYLCEPKFNKDELIFNGKKEIIADWYTGDLILRYGNVTSGFMDMIPTYSRWICFEIKNGKVISKEKGRSKKSDGRLLKCQRHELNPPIPYMRDCMKSIHDLTQRE